MDTMSPRQPLDIEDYLEASSDASARSRNMVLLLMVASILAFAGLLNSLQNQWMAERIERLGDPKGEYTQSWLGAYPAAKNYKSPEDYSKAVDLYEKRYLDFCNSIQKAYVDNSLTIRVPVLGFSFDVNDLALLSGIGFIVILSCYRFFLSREIDNIRVSFAEAKSEGLNKLEEFYRLLAMRQVFTVPIGQYINRTPFLRLVPKAISWLPLLVLLAVMGNDAQTLWVAHELGWSHFLVNFSCTLACALILFFLCLSVTVRLLRMDRIWENCWLYIEAEKKEPGTGECFWDLDGSKTPELALRQQRPGILPSGLK